MRNFPIVPLEQQKAATAIQIRQEAAKELGVKTETVQTSKGWRAYEINLKTNESSHFTGYHPTEEDALLAFADIKAGL